MGNNELQSFQYSAKVQLFENGNKGTEIILNNPTDQTIERIDWVNYTGESEMVAGGEHSTPSNTR